MADINAQYKNKHDKDCFSPGSSAGGNVLAYIILGLALPQSVVLVVVTVALFVVLRRQKHKRYVCWSHIHVHVEGIVQCGLSITKLRI